MARREPTAAERAAREAAGRKGRHASKVRAAAMRQQKRLLLSAVRTLDEDKKAAIRKAAEDRLTQLLGLSVQHCEDVLTGDIRRTRERGGEKVEALGLTDKELAAMQDAVSERVMDRTGLSKRSALEVSGSQYTPLEIVITRAEKPNT